LAILVLFVETILVTILMIFSMTGVLNNSISPGILIVFWIASIATLLGTIIIRRYTKQKYKRELTIYETSPDLRENEYFYQAPLYIFDGIHIKIHGMSDTTWTPYFNNNAQKWLSVFDIFPVYGVKLTSGNHTIILKRTKLWSLKPRHKVFIDGEEVGILQMTKLLKGGIKQQTPYVLMCTPKVGLKSNFMGCIFMGKHYKLEFKLKIVQEYLNGNLSFQNVAKKYHLPDKSVVQRWVN